MLNLIITVVIGVTLLIIGSIVLLKIRSISITGKETEGVIVDFKKSFSANDSQILYPIISFKTETGTEIIQQNSISIIPGTYKKGSKITVVYNKENPEKFYLKGWQTFAIPAFLILIGLVFLTTFLLNIIP